MKKSKIFILDLIYWGIFLIVTFCDIGTLGIGLTQFQLPLCCYEVPFLQSPSSSSESISINNDQFPLPRRIIDEKPIDEEVNNENVKDSSETDQLIHLSTTSSNNRSSLTPGNEKIQTFYFRILPPENRTNQMTPDTGHSKTKRKTEVVSREKANRVVDFNLDFEHEEYQQFDKRNNSTITRQMPHDWKTKLKTVLFQSMRSTRPKVKKLLKTMDRTAESRIKLSEDLNEESKLNERSDALWEQIYDAPLQVIDPSTRRERVDSTALAPLESMTSPNERISGVMVNTETGIELRTSDYVEPTTEESKSTIGDCNCHLIHHGDTLLAYWSVGFSGDKLEYLIYPAPHNVPTPPIFERFHTQPLMQPSPIDLNPLIMSRSIDRIPFQPSLAFGVGLRDRSENFFDEQSSLLKSPIGYPPLGPIGERLPPTRAIVGGNVGLPLPLGLLYRYPGLPNLGLDYNQKFRFGGGFVPQFLPNVLSIPTPIQKNIDSPPRLDYPRDHPIIDNRPLPPPIGLVKGIGGTLDSFNPNHPKSIQEIIFERNSPIGPLRNDDVIYGRVPFGPNSGDLYPPPLNNDFDQYPLRTGSGQNSSNRGRYPPPQDNFIHTRPPGILVEDFGFDDNRRKPGDYNNQNYNNNYNEIDRQRYGSQYLEQRKYKDNRLGADKPTYYSGSNSNSGKKIYQNHDIRNLNSEKNMDTPYLLNF